MARTRPARRAASAVRVRSARRRKAILDRWLTRQLNDPYVAEARRLGYRSRAAFKLIELDERFRLLRPGRRVVDLGCAPGGWTQVAVERVGPRGTVVGIDLAETAPWPAPPCFAAISATRLACGDRAALGGLADVVLSDMAPAATGHAATDHLRIVALAEDAFAVGGGNPAARRRLCRQSVPGRRRGRAARPAEAGLRRAAPCQAAGEPRRIGRDLRRRDRVPRRPIAAAFGTELLPAPSWCIVRRHRKGGADGNPASTHL